jgi:DNA repair protein RAD16
MNEIKTQNTHKKRKKKTQPIKVQNLMSDSKFAEPVYVIECAKSGRANCRRCDCKIDGKSVRVGLIIEGDWGLFTRWQHLDCTVFHSSIESVSKLDGFNELSSEHQRLVLERFKTGSSEVDEEQSPINPDELVRKNWDCPADPSDDLLVSLLPFQKEGLGWMLHQEDTSVHGGILADEMGMGIMFIICSI